MRMRRSGRPTPPVERRGWRVPGVIRGGREGNLVGGSRTRWLRELPRGRRHHRRPPAAWSYRDQGETESMGPWWLAVGKLQEDLRRLREKGAALDSGPLTATGASA